jgi:hypothetical protein
MSRKTKTMSRKTKTSTKKRLRKITKRKSVKKKVCKKTRRKNYKNNKNNKIGGGGDDNKTSGTSGLLRHIKEDTGEVPESGLKRVNDLEDEVRKFNMQNEVVVQEEFDKLLELISELDKYQMDDTINSLIPKISVIIILNRDKLVCVNPYIN